MAHASPPKPAGRVHAVRDDALGADDATALLSRLARREVSAAELREAAIRRAHDVQPRLNAVAVWVDGPVSRLAAGQGPLAGLPTAIKDDEDLAGYPTSHGSRATADRPATASGPFAAQFLSLGVAPIAKTTLPEFGLTATTESSRFGATRNPWDPARSTGGSSGGSAALVAAGVVPLAHGNDGGGSIRIPAACCGLVGLKPTRGRVVDLPEIARLPVPIVCQGVLTRSVRDTALVLAEAERAWRNPGLPPIGRVTAPGAQRLRIGLIQGLDRSAPISPETTAAVSDVARLCADLGHEVREVPTPGGDRLARDFLRYWALLAFAMTAGGDRLWGPGFDPTRTERLTQGLADYFRVQAERLPASVWRLRRLARDHEDGYDQVDVLLSPVLAHEPPPIGDLGPEVPFRTHLLRLLRYSVFTPLQNVSGSPGISLPLGRTATGLPIGVHFGAPFGHERRLLELALELEAARPWPRFPVEEPAATDGAA